MKDINEFCLQGKFLYFDEHPIRRELLVETTFGAFHPTTDKCPIFVSGSCKMPSGRKLEPGDRIRIYGHIVSIQPRKTRFIKLIATEISRDATEKEGKTPEMNKAYHFYCDICGKRVDVKASDREEALRIMKADGWSCEYGFHLAIYVGIWTCPECQKKEVTP